MKKQFPSNSLTLCKSQAIIDEAKKRQIKIISIRLYKNPLGDLKGLPKQKGYNLKSQVRAYWTREDRKYLPCL
jgi:hypothetical protein